jgi:hypothetical protein
MTAARPRCTYGREKHDWDYFRGLIRMCYRPDCGVVQRWVAENHAWQQAVVEGPFKPPTFWEEISHLDGDILQHWYDLERDANAVNQPLLRSVVKARSEECLKIHEQLMDILARHAFLSEVPTPPRNRGPK